MPANRPRSFLASLDEDDAEELRRLGRVRQWEGGRVLFHERQPADSVCVVLSGWVKLAQTCDSGREIVLAVRGPGDVLGELSAIDGDPRSATGTALEDVEALVVPAGPFREFLRDHSEAALAIVSTLSARLRDADSKRVEFAARDTIGRLASRLLELAERFGDNDNHVVTIELPLSQEELAGWTGCSREAVSRAMQSMRALGWIETNRRTLTLLELSALRERAGEA